MHTQTFTVAGHWKDANQSHTELCVQICDGRCISPGDCGCWRKDGELEAANRDLNGEASSETLGNFSEHRSGIVHNPEIFHWAIVLRVTETSYVTQLVQDTAMLLIENTQMSTS